MTILNKDKILDAAKEFITQGKTDKAIREYEKLLQADPKDMRIKLRIAELFVKLRKIPQAIQLYQEVANAYEQDGFYLKAVTVLKNILRLNPSLLEVNKSLSQLYEKMGLASDAAHQYEILASAYEQKGQYEEALNVRERLVALVPEETSYRIRLAESYKREERSEDAIKQYEVLAEQYAREKREPKRLIELYERILPFRPENRKMLTELVDLYFSLKDYKAALRWLETKKQIVSQDAHLLNFQAKICGFLNQLDSARGKYQDLAKLYVAQGEVSQALQALEEILVLLPEELENIREEAKAIQPDAVDALIRRADARRAALNPVEKGPKIDEEKRPKEKVIKQEITKERSEQKRDLLMLFKQAKNSLALVSVYLKTGLEEEANQERETAKKKLGEILQENPSHQEALQLLKTLQGEAQKRREEKIEKREPTVSPSSKKKISFV